MGQMIGQIPWKYKKEKWRQLGGVGNYENCQIASFSFSLLPYSKSPHLRKQNYVQWESYWCATASIPSFFLPNNLLPLLFVNISLLFPWSPWASGKKTFPGSRDWDHRLLIILLLCQWLLQKWACDVAQFVPVRCKKRFAKCFRKRHFLALKKEPLKRVILPFSCHHRGADEKLRTATALFPPCRS